MPRFISPAKFVGETRNVKFDFAGLFAYPASDSITYSLTSPVVTCSVYSGTDAAPLAMLVGAPFVSGFAYFQQVTGGVVGVIYKLTCTAALSATPSSNYAGEVVELSTFLTIIPEVV